MDNIEYHKVEIDAVEAQKYGIEEATRRAVLRSNPVLTPQEEADFKNVAGNAIKSIKLGLKTGEIKFQKVTK